MQVTKEPLEPCQVALTIEVESDKVAQAVDRAYREYGKYVSVPGFRKGKAPQHFVRQRIPESDVRQRTAEILVEPAYNEAIKQEEVQPYAPPKLELVQLDLGQNPFIFKAVVPLAPQVELGTYTGLEVERNHYILTDEDIDAQIERMRERAADFPKVERPIEAGDLVIGDVSAVTEARPDAAEPKPTMIEVGAAGNIPGFDEQLIGMTAGESKTFTLPYPEDYGEEDLAGEEAEFTVNVVEVRARELPPLGDELAQKISNGKIETLEALKNNLRTDMERNLAQTADNQLEQSIVNAIIATSTIKYPPVLVEAEIEDDARQFGQRLQQQQATIEDYLEQSGRTREELYAEFREAAVKRIEAGLILGAIAEKESLGITTEDVDAEIAAQAEQQNLAPAALRAMIESNNSLEAFVNRTQTKKVLDFLRAATIIKEKEVRSTDVDEDAEEDPIEEAGEDAAEEVIFAGELEAETESSH